ncbi:hypothetical protein [Fibrella arboris]|uniref:hypothetical protein n=1 Tax=Fibrella arboris TaxID=3242486 RepID=UPI003522F39E
MPNAYSVNWSVTGPHSIANTNATNVTVNYGSTAGIGYISAFITDVCSYTANPKLQVGVGTPYVSSITFDGSPNSGPAATPSGSTHYLAAYTPNSPSTTWSIGVTNNSGDINTTLYGVNGGFAEIYVYGTVGNSAIIDA